MSPADDTGEADVEPVVLSVVERDVEPDAEPDAEPDVEPDRTGNAVAPLAGRRVVVTRATSQSKGLVESLAALGAEVIELPLIEIVPSADNDIVLARELAAVDEYDWLIITSPNGAACVCAQHADAPRRCRIAVVGRATATALAPFAPVDFVPVRPNAAGLVAEFAIEPIGRALLVQGDLAPPLVADHLIDHGWDVRRVVAYSTVAARPDPSVVTAAAEADAITFLSSSAVRAFADVVGIDHLPPVVVSIGPSTTWTLRELGVTKVRQSATSTLSALVKTVSVALQ